MFRDLGEDRGAASRDAGRLPGMLRPWPHRIQPLRTLPPASIARSVRLVACISSLVVLGWVFALPLGAQVGSAGSVAETGEPVHLPGEATTKGGPVYESRLPAGSTLRLPLSGYPVSSGRQGVAGSGSVRDASAGSVADIGRAPQLQWLPPPAFGEEQLPAAPPPAEGLLSVIRSVEPLPRQPLQESSAAEAHDTASAAEPDEEVGSDRGNLEAEAEGVPDGGADSHSVAGAD